MKTIKYFSLISCFALSVFLGIMTIILFINSSDMLKKLNYNNNNQVANFGIIAIITTILLFLIIIASIICFFALLKNRKSNKILQSSLLITTLTISITLLVFYIIFDSFGYFSMSYYINLSFDLLELIEVESFDYYLTDLSSFTIFSINLLFNKIFYFALLQGLFSILSITLIVRLIDNNPQKQDNTDISKFKNDIEELKKEIELKELKKEYEDLYRKLKE